MIGTGSGFLYSLAPTVTFSLTGGAVSKTYDGNTTALLGSASYNLIGVEDGDTVYLRDPITGSYEDKYVGGNKRVILDLLSAHLATNGPVNVYGYQFELAVVEGFITPLPIGETLPQNIMQGELVFGQTCNHPVDTFMAVERAAVNYDNVRINYHRFMRGNRLNISKNTIFMTDDDEDSSL